MTSTTGSIRTRWAAIGAAVAVTLGAGTIATVDAVQSSGERLTYVATDPCRLMNTRPGTNQVGPLTTPLPGGAPIKVEARGAQGNCSATQLPSDARALQLNVTPVNATASTDITIWPSGPIPQASSVNPRPGPPVPNAVVATLAPDGSFLMQNKFGTIDMVIDVLGYYVDHNHDDRYYTETEIDTALADKADTGDVYTRAEIDALLADKADTALLQPYYAQISVLGEIQVGVGVLSSVRNATGSYTVTFDTDVEGRNCIAIANDAVFASTNDVSTDHAEGSTNQVVVTVRDEDGALANTWFNIALICDPRI